jgi:RNA polymerase sigma-70 factor (ECF subfamily)
VRELPEPADTRADELLAIRCQLGEPRAFDALIRRWHRPLFDYLRRQSASDDAAADLAQETWLRVFRGIGRLRDAASLRPWLFGIARRTWIDHLRARSAQVIEVDDAASGDVADDAAPIDERLDLDALHREVARLPALEREVLALFHLDELALSDIAHVLSVPLGTVKSRLHRARRLLRRELERHETFGDRS